MGNVIREFPMDRTDAEPPTQSKIGPVPRNWQVLELAAAVDYIDYGISAPIPKTAPPGGVKIVSTADITKDGQILYGAIRRLVAPIRTVQRLTLKHGDVLFNWRNSSELIGKSAVFEEQQEPHVFASFVLRIRCDEMRSHNMFLCYLMNYYREQGVFINLSRRAVNQSNYNRNEISVLPIPLPPIDEQRQIAAALSVVRRAIKRQERLIALTSELKKALMHKLFTDGTRGERLKQTEIGRVPESWTVGPLKEFTESFQYGTSVKCGYDVKGLPVLRIPNVVGGHLDVNDLKFGNPKKNELETARIRSGDLLFVRTNGVRENAGRCSIYRGELGESCYFASYLIRARVRDELMPEFLEEYTRTEAGVRLLAGRAVRTADGKFNINTGTLETLLVPKPEIDEQKAIADVLGLIDKKARSHRASKAILEALFRTLLHQLMTAQIRVNDLDLSALDEKAPVPAEVA
jgi:type I restriction enzyme S subunit